MLFGNIGTELGYKVVHHSFAGHAVRGKGERREHNVFQLLLADAHLLRANQVLRRSFPPRSAFVKHLLQRNLYKAGFLVFRTAMDKAEKMGFELNEEFLDDPCMKCEFNEVIHHDGTFLRVEELEPINGRPRFGKVHKCSCGTIFLIAH